MNWMTRGGSPGPKLPGPDGRIRLKSRYKCDDAGRILEESQSAPDGTLQHKIVHNYDSSGKETGYSVFDASGKISWWQRRRDRSRLSLAETTRQNPAIKQACLSITQKRRSSCCLATAAKERYKKPA